MFSISLKSLFLSYLVLILLAGPGISRGDINDDQLFISEVQLSLSDIEPDRIVIHGNNFDFRMDKGYLPSVLLGSDTEPLEIDQYDGFEIIALCPPDTDGKPACSNGDYLLQVILLGNKGKPTKYSASFDLTIGSVGPVGPQGPAGDQGEQGLQGLKGTPGDPGPTGLAGETGAAGPQGIQGMEGPQGPAGEQGEQGLQGPKGDPGDLGPIGLEGETGAAGPQGIQGLKGPQGLTGEQGEQGFQGLKGDPGDQGPIGLTGDTGATGPQGIPGAQGSDGVVILTTEECVEIEGEYPLCEERSVITVPVSYGIDRKLIAGHPDPSSPETVVEVTKTEPRMIYPLVYFHTVPYTSYEEVIRVPNSIIGVQSCNDSADSNSPSCGWTLNGGVEIDQSQGFCCNKNLEMISGSSGKWRGEAILNQTSSAVNSFSTAHCLRNSEQLFDGYEISEPYMTYDIEITFTKSGYTRTEVISPENPIIEFELYSGYWVRVELQDQISVHHGTPNFNNYILYIPSLPVSDEMFLDYAHNMLLVPREEVSRDGSELDKVGVSYYAFRKMGGDCAFTIAGDGLSNQLYHKHMADLSLGSSLESTYLLWRKRWFRSGNMSFESQMEKRLVYAIKDINYSRLLLSMPAQEKLSLLETESAGSIVSGSVESFISMSRDGLLKVQIENSGQVKTDYIVTVTDGSQRVMAAIPAQARALEPMTIEDLYFDLHGIYNLDAESSVKVTLKSPTGRLYDEMIVGFDVMKHEVKPSWEQRMINEGSSATQ